MKWPDMVGATKVRDLSKKLSSERSANLSPEIGKKVPSTSTQWNITAHLF